MTKVIVLSLAILIIFIQITANSAFTAVYSIHIINALSNNDVPLTVQCESKKADFEKRNIKVGDDFYFEFSGNVLDSTRFYCHYWWGSKNQFFDVFNKDISPDCGKISENNYECFWKVLGDGFYFGGHNFPGSYSKRFAWNNV
ncbi:hypothetical protein T459_09345 [Capsicum annuum]|uniref:S-protein homolog n=1 Tax=Capsicum annuum TaxID=4072 RepID=A0A2G2ZZ42_CAPAN|nr:hypothetical protein T459_09345 [Capsicum annuum]